MFDVAIQFMVELVNFMPIAIVLILVFNIISNLLFNHD